LLFGRVYQSWRINGLGHMLATMTLAWLVTVTALLAMPMLTFAVE